jgi:predicted nucleic acid-binding protein
MPPSLRDPDDVHVLGCAVSAGADAVVTGDRDLLALGTYAAIPIIDIRAALRELALDE